MSISHKLFMSGTPTPAGNDGGGFIHSLSSHDMPYFPQIAETSQAAPEPRSLRRGGYAGSIEFVTCAARY
jgi:hypothetical protein